MSLEGDDTVGDSEGVEEAEESDTVGESEEAEKSSKTLFDATWEIAVSSVGGVITACAVGAMVVLRKKFPCFREEA